jgi:glycosyltransferase involved in cell wall biosynthesis
MELTTIQQRSLTGGKRRANINTIELDRSKRDFPIIVHSHLAWDWVWQRPQQFHARLSARHPILFVEGPRPSDLISATTVSLRDVDAYPNIVVLQIEIPASRWSDGAWVDKERRRVVKSVLAGPLGHRFVNPVQWFYDPMAVTAFAGHMDEQAIVYDCMDELSQFRGAPPELIRRERELLAVADVVFGGGPKLAQAKRRYHSNVYSYGCGVDVDHFGKARHARTKVAADVADLAAPVLGYFGVVDERIDYDLLAQLADHDPNWNVAIVGPCTKVDRATFPERPNLHWLGARDYAQLPSYVKKYDVCLMPFAINEATEFINPTKALEYMASARPIVSTAVEDVVLQFDHVVDIASSRDEFVLACEKAINERDQRQINRGLKLARQNSWESIVAQLEKHVHDVLATKRSVATTAA